MSALEDPKPEVDDNSQNAASSKARAVSWRSRQRQSSRLSSCSQLSSVEDLWPDEDMSDMSFESYFEDEYDVVELVDNDVSRKLKDSKVARNRFSVDLTQFLEHQISDRNIERSRKYESSKPSSFMSDIGVYPASPLDSGRPADWRSRSSTQNTLAVSSEEPSDQVSEREQFRMLFSVGTEPLSTQHRSLGKVVNHIFGQQDKDLRTSSVVTVIGSEHGWPKNWRSFVRLLRQQANELVTRHSFSVFYLVMTVYMLFSPDLAHAFGTRDVDEPLMVVNTVVFFLFSAELVLFMLGQRSYLLSISCVLDVVALLSFITDTVLLNFLDFDAEGARVLKMARSSRMTRLARMARVARVTRLIPRLLRLCTKQKTQLARIVLLRRLWRIFCFLDTDMDGEISTFDTRILYLVIAQECPEMFQNVDRSIILHKDVREFLSLQAVKENRKLTFDDFLQILLRTGLGKRMDHHHRRDVAQDHGVLHLMQTLSDKTALKMCVGIIGLVGAATLLQVERQDASPLQGLAQLDGIAHRARQPGSPWSPETLCEQIGIYTDKHEAVHVYLDGRTYWQNGQCIRDGIPVSEMDVYASVDSWIEENNRRESEVIKVCWPHVVDCKPGNGNWTSLALLDVQDQARTAALSAAITTFVIIALLLIFVYILNLGISKFSKTMLEPLRAISDDMTALSNMDLLQIDSEMPGEGGAINVAEELLTLQHAFHTMRGAIRSWSKYVPPSVVQRLFASGIEASVGVGRCDVSVLFCDISGFEDICAGLPPDKVLSILSSVLDNIAEVIHKKGGTLIEFIGDEVLAVFNTPNLIKHHTYEAVKSAVEIHAVVQRLPPTTKQDGSEAKIKCRCGVHTANLLAGNLGSFQRIKYGVLGDGVNLTARMKGLNSRYGTFTLASDAVLKEDAVRRRFIYRPIDLVAVKGKKEPTRIIEVLRPVHLAPSEQQQDTLWLKQAASQHAEAWRLYLERDFEQAKILFNEVFQAFKGTLNVIDEPSRLMRQRCFAHMKEPPPDDWDGVDRLTKKTFEIVQEEKEGLSQAESRMSLCSSADETEISPESPSEIRTAVGFGTDDAQERGSGVVD